MEDYERGKGVRRIIPSTGGMVTTKTATQAVSSKHYLTMCWIQTTSAPSSPRTHLAQFENTSRSSARQQGQWQTRSLEILSHNTCHSSNSIPSSRNSSCQPVSLSIVHHRMASASVILLTTMETGAGLSRFPGRGSNSTKTSARNSSRRREDSLSGTYSTSCSSSVTSSSVGGNV